MMDESLVNMASEVLGIGADEVKAHCKPMPEIGGYYVWNPARGGRAMLLSEGGDRLVATSAVSFSRHLADYRAGRRN